MAYSRFGLSDIYIYPSVYGDVTCCGCLLGDSSVDLSSDKEILEHIAEHRRAGHNIPDELEDDILSDPDRFGILDIED